MKSIGWLTRLMLAYWPRILLALFLSVLTITSHIGLMAASAYLLARAALHPPILDLMVTIVGVRFFGLSRAVFRYLERYLSHDVTFRVLSQIRVKFYEQIEPLAPARLGGLRSEDLLSRIVADVETQQNFYLRVFAPPIAAFFVLIGYGIFLANYDIRLSYILAACFVIAGVIVPWLVKRLGQGIGAQIIFLKAHLNTQVADGLLGMTELLSYHQVGDHLIKFRETNDELIECERKITKLAAFSAALTGLIANLGMWLILVLGILLVEKGRLNGVNLGMLALGTLSSFEAVFPLALVPHHLEQNLVSADRLLDLMKPEETKDGRDRKKHDYNRENDKIRHEDSREHEDSSKNEDSRENPGKLIPRADNLKLSFQEVSFRYEKTEPWVLKDVSFTIPQGSKVAIVGSSGVGKTSIINLILRFWDCEKGEISLGDHSLPEYDIEELRRIIGVVTQKTYLFNATIKENLLLAKPSATNQELMDTARQAKLHEFITSLPNGYDSYIGEGGFKLSGGQRQRLAIARVLLKNAPILILDEAAAGLDSITESEVLNEVYRLMEGRTTILITHNFSGLEIMDEILLLKEGRIIERGTHAELLQHEGAYWELWKRDRFIN
ncbi:cysteine export CydDC family ABC transporter permease subunit/ATP-binding protein CydC [Desulfosporosinus acidiphilus SJ4]|uniref:Cysteine export CydDC family ABC transporter permease subunit/ATP-binding protein CydC n=1 Tax=Desulfosporosinus acidiphilus (strain DSM 22704 / JCM 16185 / SJ4) TaxID=646529 RepID=I4D694_DESAJ|nr:thiol reductant ABC exporter subunit CydC [Desulfosporosinus acidiphilus]AFM41318.1 cysteine export CydDC family ABC transporter permease subunit/ATP-binding protein CydC [Desulfosporosinus acidiphilus SJ4]